MKFNVQDIYLKKKEKDKKQIEKKKRTGGKKCKKMTMVRGLLNK